MSVRVPFVGGSYELARKEVDTQRSVNLCPTQIEVGNGKVGMFLEPIPGLARFSEPPPDVLVTLSNLQTLDWAWAGQPYCDIPAAQSFPLTGTLNYAQGGRPFVVTSA